MLRGLSEMQVKATMGEFKNSSYYVKGNNVVYVKHWFGNWTVYLFIPIQSLVNPGEHFIFQ